MDCSLIAPPVAQMGKTAGAVWIHNDKLPAYDYWQFWRNTEDQDVQSSKALYRFTTSKD